MKTEPWQEKLLSGSWRYVPFWIKEHTLEGGRRVAVHELAARDEILTEDMGRKGRKFAVTFFGLGRDYFHWRDDMRAALEESGPGTLSHPYLGEFQAQVEDFSLSEKPEEGGLFRCQVTFIEAENELRVESELAKIDRKAQTGAAAELVKEKIAPGLTSSLLATLRTATAGLDAATAFLEDLRAMAELAELREILGALGELASAAERLRAEVESIAAFAMALINAVETVANALLSSSAPLPRAGSASGSADEAGATSPASSALVSRSDPGRQIGYVAEAASQIGSHWTDPAAGLPSIATGWNPIAATARQTQAAQVAQAVALAGRAAFFSSLATAAVEAEFTALDSALEAASALDALADSIARDPSASEELRRATYELRVAAELYLRDEVARLPRRGTYTPAVTMPALLIAQELYGDARRAEEIAVLNAIPNPLFCPGGVPLEVLSAQ